MTLQRCWAEWTRWWIMGGESGVCNIISTSIAIIEWWGRQMHIYSHQSLLRQFRPLLWNKSLEAPLAELSCGNSVLLRSKQDIIDARTSALPVRILITSTASGWQDMNYRAAKSGEGEGLGRAYRFRRGVMRKPSNPFSSTCILHNSTISWHFRKSFSRLREKRIFWNQWLI